MEAAVRILAAYLAGSDMAAAGEAHSTWTSAREGAGTKLPVDMEAQGDMALSSAERWWWPLGWPGGSLQRAIGGLRRRRMAHVGRFPWLVGLEQLIRLGLSS